MKIKSFIYILIVLNVLIILVVSPNTINTTPEDNEEAGTGGEETTKENENKKTNDTKQTEQECIINGTCFNSYNSTCINLTANSYSDIEEYFTKYAKENDIVNINQINCGTDYENCYRTEPTKGIKEDCTKIKVPDGSCCYMTVKYKNNKKYACYPIKKDKNAIQSKIKQLKEKYDGSKKISIDCYSSFFKNLFSRLLILVLFI